MAFNLQPDDVSHPTAIILDGSNYELWMLTLESFLREQNLWCILTGLRRKPTKHFAETAEKFADKLEEWNSDNRVIISCLKNTSIPSISALLDGFDTAKEAWDFLTERYATGNLARQCQSLIKLRQLRQQPDQFIGSFHFQMHNLWEQLAVFEPKWCCPEDAERFLKYRDNMRLVQFLMALDSDYDSTMANLLRRHPLPSYDGALSELVSQDHRLGELKHKSSDVVMASTSNSPHFQQPKKLCAYCERWGHSTYDCYKRQAVLYEVGYKPVGLIMADLEAVIDHMSPDNAYLKGQVIAAHITSVDTLRGVVSLIFNKAVMNPTLCPMYASFCADLHVRLPSFPPEEPGGKEIKFKGLLLNKCQEAYEGADKLREEVRQMNAPEQEDKERLLKRRNIGNIRLIGELLNNGMVAERLVRGIVGKLLGNDTSSCPEEENVEAVCVLLSTVGKHLDEGLKLKHINDIYFNPLKDLLTMPELAVPIRLMVGDVLDLRSNNWIPRTEEVKANSEDEENPGLHPGGS